jgi:hypothetical protein
MIFKGFELTVSIQSVAEPYIKTKDSSLASLKNLTANVQKVPVRYRFSFLYPVLRIWIPMIRMCLGLPDPDPLVRGTEPDPDPHQNVTDP